MDINERIHSMMQDMERDYERERAVRLYDLLSKNPYYTSRCTIGGHPVNIESAHKVNAEVTFLLGTYVEEDGKIAEGVWDMQGNRIAASVHSSTNLRKEDYIYDYNIYIKEDGKWLHERLIFMDENKILYNSTTGSYATVLNIQGNFYNYAFTAEETHLKDSMLAHEKDSLDGAQRFANLEEINRLLNEANVKLKEEYKNDPELKAENEELLNTMKTMELRYDKTVDDFQRWLQEEKARRVQAENEVEVLTMQLQSLQR